MNTNLKILSAFIIVIFLCGTVTGCGHTLSGKYSYNNNNGIVTILNFDSDGSVSLYEDNYGTINGNYYWDSSEHRYYLEFPGENWWGGSEAVVYTAEPITGGLRLMYNGRSWDLKKGV